MKNRYAILVSVALISISAFAQKDELKTLKKIHDKDAPSDKDVIEYKAAVGRAEAMLGTASEGDKVYINFHKAETPLMEFAALMSKPENQAKPQLAMKMITPEKVSALATAYNDVREYEKKSGKLIFTKDIQETVTYITPFLFDYAVNLGANKQYLDASKIFNGLYELDKTKPDYLFNASIYAVNAQDFDAALGYYDQLKKINYSGEGTVYYATSVANGQEEPFNSKEDMNKMVSLKTHTKPREEKIPSKRGEIYKNIALILMQKGKDAEAKAAFADAIKENPDDTNLLMNEADLYLKLKDYDTYKAKVAKILEKKPNDVNLIYNIGVITLEGGHPEEAEAYFKKAIEIDPKHVNSYMNLSLLKLRGDDKIVDEMNKLGTSEKDNKKYEMLKKQRETMFNNALPYLEKAHELDPKNEAVTSTLMTVYNFLEMTDKYKALKATLPAK